MSAVIAPSPSSVEEGRLGERQRGLAAGWAALDASGMRTFWLVCATVLVAQFVGLVVYSAYLYRRFDLTDDFATYAQAWWAIGHGHLDPIDTIQAPTYPFWQSHFELAMWPIALIGRVWPHSVQLLWLQDLALVATEWLAMAWVAAICAARSGRARTFVALVALAFLVVNPWWYLAASFDVHFETLGLPFVVLSGYSLWRGRPRTAVVVAAVGVLFGDVVALGVLCVGIAALVSRHARRASGTKAPLAVTLLSAGWVVLATALDANKGSGIVTNYGWLVGADAGREQRVGARPPRPPSLPRRPRAVRPDRWDRAGARLCGVGRGGDPLRFLRRARHPGADRAQREQGLSLADHRVPDPRGHPLRLRRFGDRASPDRVAVASRAPQRRHRIRANRPSAPAPCRGARLRRAPSRWRSSRFRSSRASRSTGPSAPTGGGSTGGVQPRWPRRSTGCHRARRRSSPKG